MFVFKMQSVLDYRKHIEEKILASFSKIKRELEREKDRLKKIARAKEDNVSQLRKMRNETVHAEDIARYLSFIEQLRQDEKKQKIVIDNVKNQLEEKRKELLEAVKKRKVMEKLKEKHRAEYEEESLALEQKNSDEISVLKYGRREK